MVQKLSAKTSKRVRLINRMMMVASIIHPLTTVPQVYEIYSSQNATSVSLLTWLGFMVIGLIFLAYGLTHKLTPFIVNQIIWFVLDLIIIIGIILYG
ncbi:MAG: hypothetical protein L0H36_01440 [bacterium]|nr:hypothetical protein [bacterium]MDN5835280.1 hypothetical protein [bacterium]